MPIDLEYSNTLKILNIRVRGYLTIESFEDAVQRLLSTDEYRNDVNAIWDLRDMLFDNIDIAFMKQVIEMQKKYAEHRGEAKIAIVSNYFLAAPIIKLFVILSKSLRQKYKAFTSLTEAEQWLSEQ